MATANQEFAASKARATYGKGWSPATAAIKGRPQPDYSGWSVEELRAFAAQMQLPNAQSKSRRELLRLLGVGAS